MKINSSNYRYRSKEARCRPGGGTRAWPLKKQIFIKIKICWEMFVFWRFNSPGPRPPRCPRRARSKRPWSRRRWSGAGPAGGPGSLREKKKEIQKHFYFFVRESTFFGGVLFLFLRDKHFPLALFLFLMTMRDLSSSPPHKRERRRRRGGGGYPLLLSPLLPLALKRHTKEKERGGGGGKTPTPSSSSPPSSSHSCACSASQGFAKKKLKK